MTRPLKHVPAGMVYEPLWVANFSLASSLTVHALGLLSSRRAVSWKMVKMVEGGLSDRFGSASPALGLESETFTYMLVQILRTTVLIFRSVFIPSWSIYQYPVDWIMNNSTKAVSTGSYRSQRQNCNGSSYPCLPACVIIFHVFTQKL